MTYKEYIITNYNNGVDLEENKYSAWFLQHRIRAYRSIHNDGLAFCRDTDGLPSLDADVTLTKYK
jgi:hypothetical protein